MKEASKKILIAEDDSMLLNIVTEKLVKEEVRRHAGNPLDQCHLWSADR